MRTENKATYLQCVHVPKTKHTDLNQNRRAVIIPLKGEAISITT